MLNKTPKNQTFPKYDSPEFYLRVQEGLKRAPEERAIAVKEFWGWIMRSA